MRRRRLVFAGAGCVAGLALAPMPDAIVAAALLAGGGWHMAGFAAARRERERAQRVAAALPEALDLLALCAVAGMGVEPALRLVARETSGPLAGALRRAVAMLDVGLPREAAYDAFAEAAGTPEAAALVGTLRRADRYGAPLAGVLARHAAEARERHLAAVRERALGAPVRMLFPLTLCFLPAFVLLAIAPSLIVALRAFRAG